VKLKKKKRGPCGPLSLFLNLAFGSEDKAVRLVQELAKRLDLAVLHEAGVFPFIAGLVAALGRVFQLLKHFSVETALDEQRAAFVVSIDSVSFDSDFVQNHVSFLQETLIDDTMVTDLPNAIQGTKPTVLSGAKDTANQMSTLALRYLFDLDSNSNPVGPSNLLNLPLENPSDGTKPDENDPVESFMLHIASPSGSTNGLSWGK
jgi:hypothetical protein